MTDMANFTGTVTVTGAIFTHAVRGVSMVFCGPSQRLDLVSMVHFEYFLSLFQVCRLTLGPKHPQNTVFLTPKQLFANKRCKKFNFKKRLSYRKFYLMIRGIPTRHVFILNNALLVAKCALGPHGANPLHIHIYAHTEISQFFKSKGAPSK